MWLNNRFLIRFLLCCLMFACMAFFSCGGSGSDKKSTEPVKEYIISGAAVKGPLANARVNIFVMDTGAEDLKGEFVASGLTDSQAQYPELSVGSSVSPLYLIEVLAEPGTTDINTGKQPYITKLLTVVTALQLQTNQPVYATPYTTLAIELVRKKMAAGISDYEFESLLSDAATTLLKAVGFGVNPQQDIFITPPLLIDNTIIPFEQIVAYRSAIEAICSLSKSIAEQSGLTPDKILELIVEDIIDGEFNGFNGDEAIDAFSVFPDFREWLENQVVADYIIPGSDKNDTPGDESPYTIDEVEFLLARETSTTGVSIDTTGLTNGSIVHIPLPFGTDTDSDGKPDTIDDDDDGDGYPDDSDMFPNDPEEYIDSDSDGVGDNKDFYNNDPVCYLEGDGDGTACYLTSLASKNFFTLADVNGLIYFVIPRENRILRLDNTGEHFLPEIKLSNPGEGVSLRSAVYSPAHHRIYIGYSNGKINYLDIYGGASVKQLVTLEESVVRLVTAGNYLFAATQGEAWPHSDWYYIINRFGGITDQKRYHETSQTYLWNEADSRIYYFRSSGESDLNYLSINQTSGLIFSANSSGFYHHFDVLPPLINSHDGLTLVTGFGDVIDSSSLDWEHSLPVKMSEGLWVSPNELLTVFGKNNRIVVECRNDAFHLTERRIFNGSFKAFLPLVNDYALFALSGGAVQIYRYSPSDDTDNDGVQNITDRFPLDPAASVDHDGDGYPDTWNEGKSETDSITGLKIDEFPEDSACHSNLQVSGSTCTPEETIPEFTPDKIAIDKNGIVYLLSSDHNRVFRWSSQTLSWLNPLHVGSTHPLWSESPSEMAISESQNRLWFGYNSGKVSYIDSTDNNAETVFPKASSKSIKALVGAGDYVFTASNYDSEDIHLFSLGGNILKSTSASSPSSRFVYSKNKSTVYYYGHGLRGIVIEQETAEIANISGPYISSYLNTNHLSLSEDESLIVYGNGQIFETDTLQRYAHLGEEIRLSAWFGDVLLAGSVADGKTNLKIRLIDKTAPVFDQYTFDFSALEMLKKGSEVILVYMENGIPAFTVLPVGDTDGDGLPEWWVKKYSQSLLPGSDDDEDGLTNLQEFQYLTNPMHADTDNDGLSDSEEINTYNCNPVASDSDNDGLSDFEECTIHNTNPNSHDSDSDGIDDKLETENGLDPNNPADATADTDGDGYNNQYEVLAGSDHNDPASIPDISDWGMVSGNSSHNGFKPVWLDAEEFSERWTLTHSGGIRFAATGAGQLYFTSNRTLIAVDAIKGSVNWETAVFGDARISPPGFSNDLVYVHSYGLNNDTAFWAFAPHTGEPVFRGHHRAQNAEFSAPTIYKDRAFMNGGYSGGVQAFNALTGEHIWENTAPREDYWEPAVNENHVYYINQNKLMGADPETGEVLLQAGANLSPRTPVIGGCNNVILTGKELVSISTETGNIQWKIQGGTGETFRDVAVADKKVFTVINENLIVINENTGEEEWRWEAPESLYSNVIVTLTHVFVATRNSTYAIHLKDREMVWSYDTGGQLSLSREGALYIVSFTYSESKIVAIDIEGDNDGDGMPDWWERIHGGNLEPALDEDLDLLSNIDEYINHTNPVEPDSDMDGLSDNDEVSVHGTDPELRDMDYDGLTDYDEVVTYGSKPDLSDSDGDGIDDKLEIENGLDPLNASDASADPDNDSFSNKYEIFAGTIHTDANSFPQATTWAMEQKDTSHNSFQPMVLDKKDFGERWVSAFPGYIKSPAIDTNRVFITSGKDLISLNPLYGNRLWDVTNLTDSYYISPPTIAGNLVYLYTDVNYSTSALTAFNSANGAEAFSETLSPRLAYHPPPLIKDNKAFISTGEKKLVSMDTQTGEILWEKTSDEYRFFDLTVTDSHVFTIMRGDLLGISAETGDDIFSIASAFKNQKPVIGNRNNVLLANKQIVSVDITSGTVTWRSKPVKDEYGSIVAGNGNVYASSENTLYVFNETTGHLKWQWEMDRNIEFNMVVTLTHIFISGYKKTIALDLTTREVVWNYDKGGALAIGPDGALYITHEKEISVITIEGDKDADSLPDWWERFYSRDLDGNTDDDGDTLTNLEEYLNKTDPLRADTDNDGLSDGDEVKLYHTDPNQSDTDGDELSDQYEINISGTRPDLEDTDSDGLDDKTELDNGFDPNDPADAEADDDNDGFSNLHEIFAGTRFNDNTSMPVITDWGMYQCNARHNGYQPLRLNQDDFAERWTWQRGSGYSLSAATTGAGKVFVRDRQTVTALSAETGSILWQKTGFEGHCTGAPSFGNGMVYIRSGNSSANTVSAYDHENGNSVFIGMMGNSYDCYKAPTIYNNQLYSVGLDRQYLQVFDAVAGNVLWDAGCGDTQEEPAIYGNSVIFQNSGMLRFLNPANGEELFVIDNDMPEKTPVIGLKNNILLYGKKLVCFDIDSKTETWQTEHANSYYQIPSVGNGIVLAVNGEELHAFRESSGRLLWKWDAKTTLEPEIVLTVMHAFVSTHYGRTYAIDLNTQIAVWDYPLGGKLSIGNDGNLYITDSNKLAAIRLTDK